MGNTVQDTLAAAQHQFVAWCLPGEATEVIAQATQTFNIFSQYVIALLTIVMLVVTCVTLYTTLLSFKYKETTKHDWLVLVSALGVTLTMVYFWDFMRALHSVLAPSPSVLFVLLWGVLIGNCIFVGWHLAQSVSKLLSLARRHGRMVLHRIGEWRRTTK